MASFYILYSATADIFYTGSTKDFVNRFEYHKNKVFSSGFTAKYSDWEVFFVSRDIPIGAARKIELHIKRMKSRQYIMNLKKYPDLSEKLISKYL